MSPASQAAYPVTASTRALVPLSLLLCACSFFASWSFGGSGIYPWQLFLGSRDLEPAMLQHILFTIRLPRVICAAMVGAALASAGVITQGFFRNPLASPSVLGINSGGLAASMLAFYFGFDQLGIWTAPLFAFGGCLATTCLLLYLLRSSQKLSIESLLLLGFALNSILSSLSSFLLAISLSDFNKAPAMLSYMLGTLSAKTWDHVAIGLGPIGLGLLLCDRLSYRFNVLSLGVDVARSLGLHLARLRLQTVLLIALLVATAVSIGGLLPFIGLIVPHISRLFTGPDHRLLLKVSAINGMTLLLLADLLSRVLLPNQEIQVGVLISLLGSPFFLYLVFRQRKEQPL